MRERPIRPRCFSISRSARRCRPRRQRYLSYNLLSRRGSWGDRGRGRRGSRLPPSGTIPAWLRTVARDGNAGSDRRKATLGVTCLRSRGWAVSLPCTRAIAPSARLEQQTGRKRSLALGRLLVLHPSAAAARFSAFSHCRSYFHLLLDATGRRASAKLLPQSRHQSM